MEQIINQETRIQAAQKLLTTVVRSNQQLPSGKIAGELSASGEITNISLRAFYASQPEDVQKLIYEYGLDKPDKLIQFLLDLNFACFDAVFEGIGNVRGDLLRDKVGMVKSAQDKCRMASQNPAQKKEMLKDAFFSICDALRQIEQALFSYMDQLHTIDKRSGLSALLRSKSDLKDAHSLSKLDTAAIQAYIEALNIAFVIGAEARMDLQTLQSNAEELINKLEREQLISLAAAYDPERKNNNTVWNVQKLRESFRSAMQIKQGLADYVDEFETVDLDLLLN